MQELKKLHRLTGRERLGQNRESEYLGAEDIDLDAEPVLTIEGIYNGLVTLQRGKENKDVLVFKEKSVPGLKNVRPLIVNSTNRKTLRKLFKGVTAEILEGKRIQLYVDPNTKDPVDGGTTDGIKIRKTLPREESHKCGKCGADIVPTERMSVAQVEAYSRKNFGQAMCAGCVTAMVEEAKRKKQEEANDASQSAESN